MSKRQRFEVGQTLWFRPYSKQPPVPLVEGAVVIAAVGHKWLTLENGYRVDAKSLVVEGKDGQQCPGCCYLSEDHCKESNRRQDAWEELRITLWCQFDPIDGVSADDILEAAKLLKLRKRLRL